MKRNLTLDIIRTVAIILMVVFHFIYDLKFFNYVEWDTPDGKGFREFRWLIISLFFLCLGVSLKFAHAKQCQWLKFCKRTAQIALAALIISTVTFFAVPQNWIFFGVLHFLALSSVLAIAFVSHPKLSWVIGVSIILIGVSQVIPNRWPFHLLFEGLPRYTNDFVAIFPWLGLVFLGIGIGHSKWMCNDPLAFIINRPNRRKHQPLNSSNKPKFQLLLWPGQHSLSIYLLHQPIMMSCFYIISLVL